MRMDSTRGQSAAQWLALADEQEIREVLENYAEERNARLIARAIVTTRQSAPLTRTHALAALVAETVRTRERGQHPATRTFQAIRIHVNRELAELDTVLPQALNLLAPRGRLAVISFHSLEDRLVKRFMQAQCAPEQLLSRELMRLGVQSERVATMRKVGKDLVAGADELLRNPRARSARLRVAEKRESR
jgi:16S rRNA (cytosine1402-N4)-methyltransferase